MEAASTPSFGSSGSEKEQNDSFDSSGYDKHRKSLDQLRSFPSDMSSNELSMDTFARALANWTEDISGVPSSEAYPEDCHESADPESLEKSEESLTDANLASSEIEEYASGSFPSDESGSSQQDMQTSDSSISKSIPGSADDNTKLHSAQMINAVLKNDLEIAYKVIKNNMNKARKAQKAKRSYRKAEKLFKMERQELLNVINGHDDLVCQLRDQLRDAKKSTKSKLLSRTVALNYSKLPQIPQELSLSSSTNQNHPAPKLVTTAVHGAVPIPKSILKIPSKEFIHQSGKSKKAVSWHDPEVALYKGGMISVDEAWLDDMSNNMNEKLKEIDKSREIIIQLRADLINSRENCKKLEKTNAANLLKIAHLENHLQSTANKLDHAIKYINELEEFTDRITVE